MDKKTKIFWVLFIGIILVLISIISLNYNSINYFIEQNIQDYGYPAIFLFGFFTDAIDQPIVVEVPATLGVIYGLNILYVFLVAALGVSLIGIINFNVGRIVFSKKIENLCTSKKYAKYCSMFQKYGKLSLLIAALTPVPYVTFVWLSGAFNMRFKDFFVFGMLAKALRLGIILLLGYWIVY